MKMKRNEKMIGHTFTDKITGFRGVCVGFCFYISGCHQALLTPKVDETGKHINSMWIDAQRLDQVDAEKIELDNGTTPGFDMEAPKTNG